MFPYFPDPLMGDGEYGNSGIFFYKFPKSNTMGFKELTA
jgi:hypothetical protein